MPTYSYACTECDNKFDVVQAFSDDALTECPKCDGRLRKLFGKVGVVFKGSGFYRTDSREAAKSSSNGSVEELRVLGLVELVGRRSRTPASRTAPARARVRRQQLELLGRPPPQPPADAPKLSTARRDGTPDRGCLLPSVAAWGNHSIRRC